MVPVRLASLLAVAPLAVSPSLPGPTDGGANGPDEVRTVRDKRYTGRVVFEDEERVVLREGSRDREFERDEIASLSSVRENMRLVLVYLQDAALDDLDVLLEIAAFAERSALPGVARMLWMKALLLAPDSEEANEALGNRRRSGRWELLHEGRWWTLVDLFRRTRDWSDAWELETLHFQVRTNLELGDAIDLAFDLEHLYYAYYRFLQPAVDLRETTEPMRFQVHADLTSFPEVGMSRRSYFNPDQNTAYLNFSRGIDLGTGLHEAIHVFTHNTAVSRRARGALPPWIDEGLAEYLRAACHGTPGRLDVTPGVLNRNHYVQHARHSAPYALGRVMNFAKGDYLSSTSVDLKYAQSYTLVDFFLHGDDGAWRERFLEFVAWCYEGRSSPSHFRKKMRASEEEIEAAWKRHVEYVAGGGERKRG